MLYYGVIPVYTSLMAALSVRVVETVYGSGAYYGGLQVNRYGFWGPVCNTSWDDKDANATCHGLGYGYGVTFYGRDRTSEFCSLTKTCGQMKK